MKVKKRGVHLLFLLSTGIAFCILIPAVLLAAGLFDEPTETWVHIKTVILQLYMKNTLILIVSVGTITASVGTFLAWGLSTYDFRKPRLRRALMLLPLAIPPYIGGYVYSGILNYSGSLERIMRALKMEPIHIDVMSMGGTIFVFSIFLLPYVILVASAFFRNLPTSYMENSKLLGKSDWETFLFVILPMARGAIVGGTVLVVLEVLNDYGLVSYFGIPVFSTGIYSAWFGFGDLNSAIRLAVLLMGIVFVFLSFEQFIRAAKRVAPSRAASSVSAKKKPSIGFAILYHGIFWGYIAVGVVIPIIQMIYWGSLASGMNLSATILRDIGNTLTLAVVVTGLVVGCGMIVGNFKRLSGGRWSTWVTRIVILGYSIPAPIIAVSVLVMFVKLDQSLKPVYQQFNLGNRFLSGGLVMLVFALSIRFLAIGFNSLHSGLEKLGKKHYEAAKTLGASGWESFWRVDLPQMKPAIYAAILLTFIDVLKELPLTLILRPFNFDTIATRVFTYAGDEMIHEASIFALIIVGISMCGLLVLEKIQRGKNE